MKNRGAYKLIGILALVATFAAIVVLFGLNTNSGSANPGTHSQLLFYFSILTIAISSFILFFVALSKRIPSEGVYSEEEDSQEASFSQEDGTEKEQTPFHEENQEDLRKIAEGIIPQSMPGMPGYPAEKFATEVLSNIASVFQMVQGLFFLREQGTDHFRLAGDFAYYAEKKPEGFELGTTLPGQVAKNMELLNVQNIPEDYTTVLSGLGKGTPGHLLLVPLVAEGECLGLIEISSFSAIDNRWEQIFRIASEDLGKKLQHIQHQKQEKDV